MDPEILWAIFVQQLGQIHEKDLPSQKKPFI